MTRNAKKFAVYTKAAWGGEWVKREWLYPESLQWRAAPAINSAVLSYKYGRRVRPGKTVAAVYPPLDIGKHFVQVREVSGGAETVVWTGLVFDESRRQDGQEEALSLSEQLARGGVQTFSCRGLAQLLAEASVDRGLAYDEDDEVLIQLDWSPPFNSLPRAGRDLVGNRSRQASPFGLYYFSNKPDPADAKLWSHGDVAAYLLGGALRTGGVEFRLTGQHGALSALKATLDLDGSKIWAALSELIPYRRGFGFREAGLAKDGAVEIEVFSISGTAVDENGVDIPANPRLVDVDVAKLKTVEEERYVLSRAERFDAVEVVGARLLACFSVGFLDGTLDQGWTLAAQEAYNDAEDDEARKAGKFADVFSRFVVPDKFDWQAGDGIGGAKSSVVLSCGDDGELGVGVGKSWAARKQFEQRLPFSRADLAALSGGVEPDKDPGEFAPPLAVAKLATSRDGSDVDVWVQVDTMECEDEGLTPATVRVLDDRLGFELRHRYPHIFGLSHFPGDADTDGEAVLDWEEIIATAAVRSDRRLRVAFGTGEKNAISPSDRLFRIELPEAEAWYVAPGTVVGINDGEPVRHAGGWIRNDVDTLKAALAYAKTWYLADRVSLHVSAREPVRSDGANGAPLGVGDFVRELKVSVEGGAEQAVNTVVTLVAWELGKTQRFTVETGGHDIDVRQLADVRRKTRYLDAIMRRQENELRDLRARLVNIPARPAANSGGLPIGYKATADAAGGEVKIKKVKPDGTTYGPELIGTEYTG